MQSGSKRGKLRNLAVISYKDYKFVSVTKSTLTLIGNLSKMLRKMSIPHYLGRNWDDSHSREKVAVLSWLAL